MTTTTSNGADAVNAGPAETISTSKQDHPQRTADVAVLRVPGTRYVRAGDALYDRVLSRCPLCGRAHWHVLYEVGASRIERSPACARHRTYLVEITNVYPPSVGRRAA